MTGVDAARKVADVCVLLVEDEPLIREIMAETLQDEGYEVIEAADGEAAAALIRNPPRIFSALVTDFHMPGSIDGAQLASQIRQRFPGINVIIASGRPDVFQLNWKRELGYELLKKPYRPLDLVRLLGRMRP